MVSHDLLSFKDNPICLGILPVNGFLDGLAGDDLLPLLATLVPHTELQLGSILEGPLVVQNELLPVFGLQGKEYDIRVAHMVGFRFIETNIRNLENSCFAFLQDNHHICITHKTLRI
jgi:hypothetical protein